MPLYEKLWVLVKSLSLLCFYRAVWPVMHGRTRNRASREDVVVSLTTYGERLLGVHLTLRSLLRQSVRPSAIYLWIYRGDVPEEGLPQALTDLECEGVSIRIVDENLRSYKKVVHTWELTESMGFRFLVTADDDVYYPFRWLERLLSCVDSDPGSVWCYRGHLIQFAPSGQLVPYKNWSLATRDSVSDNNLLPVGVSGICYPLEALEGVNDRQSFLALAPSADDLWLKCITTKNGYRARLAVEQSIHFVPVVRNLGRPAKGLEQENVLEDGNTRALKALMQHFGFEARDFS